ncbi:polysaccharide deacetylase family protein [Nocardiopsis alba]|uniref:Polysaccharide deacetylase family protein n=1 Tax=Nocardiopsis alba TaxID=53437 RepID=A0ABV5DQB3_9ACTN
MRKAAVGGLMATTGLLALTTAPAGAAPEDVTPDCDEVKCVALTFDDGPGEYTGRLLDMLDAHDARATFYLLGSNVADHPNEVERMVKTGHEVGSHSWRHDDLTTLSGEEIEKDLERTDKAIEDVTGQTPATLRPPYGAVDDTVREAADRPLILWDVDTEDWKNRDPGTILDIADRDSGEGSIVLFHDIHQTTVDAIPAVLDRLTDEGYTFVTVSELMGDDLDQGTAYTDARSQD